MEEENAKLRAEVKELRARLRALEKPAISNGAGAASDVRDAAPASAAASVNGGGGSCPAAAPDFLSPHGLSKSQAERYSRQLVLPAFGAAAQARLCASSALIVGCGGLGAPAALYLAAAGVGCLGLVDRDAVEISNLHRQIIHSEDRAGVHKATSAAAAVAALNSGVRVEPFLNGLRPGNAAEMVMSYDVIIDASDNAPTRYLLNDACVAAGRPLVSAAAVGTDGQLTVYCHGEDGPCYRCLFPEPPAPGNCARCADAGVLGPVPGVMGVLQALEAIKLLTGIGKPLTRQLLLFDALSGRFTTVKLRARSPGCAACGGAAAGSAGQQNGAAEPDGAGAGDGGEGGGRGRGRMRPADVAAFDYTAFTGQSPDDGPPPPLRVLPPEQRLAAAELKLRLEARGANASSSGGGGGGSGDGAWVLVDVRPKEQFDVMSLPGAVNMPFVTPESFIDRHLPQLLRLAHGGGAAAPHQGGGAAASAAAPAAAAAPPRPVYVMCRRGNHSQLAVRALREAGLAECYDLVGGIQAWAQEVDPALPIL
ncbi:adenylyltransferase andsulfurtransferase MOCS3/UBA4 [Monoraphidium neglectum]|uniref:Adenylyltransferase and sulfurtransferase MOCS3 n=1 Tax=Monoraphidium neglectum TaxID=145388 RepID=A0A0D2KWZ4_9CHLO|nr:adenylyltransferase andsulfurtransferase MOCS3/UBA4 [Monoraphidium neglectum]KIY99793.1 adenylyltransferase andsulfurtransferase MOCS3/UBA4 [Monoraphidium neglectum]|eukprot:XP_013898813.1 adenylyltransferase andsulfurtransferase MOCS3/UBA4 [Monoraphidium neglectum]